MKSKDYLYNPLTFYFVLGLFALCGIVYFDKVWLTWENKNDILIEFHGLLFDILFFGILFTIFSMITNRINDIKRYKEQIDDLKGWNSQEATFKIIANLKRLLKLKAQSIDLSNCYLVDGKLNDLNLENVKMQNSTLNQVDLKNSILKNASFKNSNINGGILTYTDLQKADFSYALLFNSFFQGANLRDCRFENATMNNSSFEIIELNKTWDDYQQILETILNSSYLNLDDIEEGEIIRANLTNCNLSYAILDESNLIGIIGKDANFNGASMEKVDLKNANLVKADLRNTNLTNANLDNANLESAQFFKTNFKGATLTNIKIRNVSFHNCELEGANFSINQKAELTQKGVNPALVNWI